MSVRFRNLLIIFVVACAVKIIPALTIPVYSSDACTYLDMARNFLAGRGLLCSYNVYQYWPGAYTPGWPFMQPLFPLLVAFIWKFVPSVHAVMVSNVFISGVNGMLLYAIAMTLYKNTRVALWSALLASVMWPMRMTAVPPWTEQLHLLSLLLALLVLIRNPGKSSSFFFSGLLIGVNCLIRVAGLYLAFLLPVALFFCEGLNRHSLKKYFLFCLGILAVLLPYEFFCYARYHLFYPVYPQAAKEWTIALKTGCQYFFQQPVLRIPDSARLHFTGSSLLQMGRHLILFFNAFLGDWPVFLCVILGFKGVSVLLKKRFEETLLLTAGLGHVFLFSATYWWLPTWCLETHRYLLIPLTLTMPLAVQGLWDIKDMLKEPFAKKYLNLYFSIAVIFSLLYMSMPAWQGSKRWAKYLFVRNPKEDSRQAALAWLKERTRTDDLIATTEFQEAYGLDRPVVSLPEEKALTKENLARFLDVYKPAYIWISHRKGGRSLELYKDLAVRVELPEILAKRYVVFLLKPKEE